MRPIKILYIEDDSIDVDLAKSALDSVYPNNGYKFTIAEDGEQAVKMIEHDAPYNSNTKPDLILLDLNLPRVHGTEVLKKIRASSEFKGIPVIILSTSSVQKDINNAYALGACAYVTKPNGLKDYVETFRSICDFWLKRVRFPTPEGAA